jgi:ribosomal protein S18 acetylase RimI-like enzyme
MLLSAATEFAESSGAIRLTLSTGRNNHVAQALYGSAQWQRDEEFFVYHRSIAP